MVIFVTLYWKSLEDKQIQLHVPSIVFLVSFITFIDQLQSEAGIMEKSDAPITL